MINLVGHLCCYILHTQDGAVFRGLIRRTQGSEHLPWRAPWRA